jgi:hypothetical protein
MEISPLNGIHFCLLKHLTNDVYVMNGKNY